MRGAAVRGSGAGGGGCISIHAPHAGSGLADRNGVVLIKKFQSTLPMRGAAADRNGVVLIKKFQSTLPMRGAAKQIFLLC